MKISNENKFTIYNETDFMNMINEFQDKFISQNDKDKILEEKLKKKPLNLKIVEHIQ